MVQTGKVFGVCLVTQSKHSVRSCDHYQQPSRARVRKGNLENRLDLAQVTRRTRFDQWDVGSHTHLVHVPPCVYTKGDQEAERDLVRYYAPRLSRAFRTMSNVLNHEMSN